MINWEKPIQAMDGRKVTVCRPVISRSGEGAKVVYVAPPPGAVFGDVFLVDEKGFRCDDSAPIPRPQIIRNVRVKREGWVLIEPQKNRTLNNISRNVRVKREGWVVKYKGLDRLYDDHIYSSEENAASNVPVGCVVIRMQWEEEP